MEPLPEPDTGIHALDPGLHIRQVAEAERRQSAAATEMLTSIHPRVFERKFGELPSAERAELDRLLRRR